MRIDEACISSNNFKEQNNQNYTCGSLQNKADNIYVKNHMENPIAFIKATSIGMHPKSNVTLKFPSVGATENLLLCFSSTKQKIELHNVAREPEIIALQTFLNTFGANISGAGSSKIIILPPQTGTDLNIKKHVFTTPTDRIVAGSFLLAGAMCGGKLCFDKNDLNLQDQLLKTIKPSIDQFEQSNYILIKFRKAAYLSDVIITSPYPGFPTDMQSPLSAYFCTVYGKNFIIESIFNKRIAHLEELSKMGAHISRYKNCFTFYGRGQTCLHGAQVTAKDLRGGLALILAGLCADGRTSVIDNSNITRGYVEIEKALSLLGADIKKEPFDSNK